MSRDDALKLLRGKAEGIAEWNRRRGDGESIPNLSHAKLSKAELGKAKLSKAKLSKAELSEADLFRATLSMADLSGADLSMANLIGASVFGADLSGADLSGADLSGANLGKAELGKANLYRADLSGADLSGADLSEANLSGANLTEADLSEADLSKAILNNAGLSKAILYEADLSKATLNNADLSKAILLQADLSMADLSNADLSGATLSKADFSKADLSGANLTEANLSKADLSGADFSKADLSKANLNGANLTGADLSFALFKERMSELSQETDDEDNAHFPASKSRDLLNANFRGATLIGVDLSGLDLTETSLQETDLTNANLAGVKSLLSERLAGADITNTELPEVIKQFEALGVIKDACSNGRKIFLAMLLASAYTILTIASTNDAQLLTNSSSSPLPIIGAKIPIAGYYWASPLILLGFYLYFHFCMQGIWDRIARLPAILPDGRPIDAAVDPWLLTGIIRSHFKRLKEQPVPFRRGQNLLSILLAWWVVPLTISWTTFDYLVVREWAGTWIHIAAWTLAVSFGLTSYITTRGTLRGAGLYKEPRIRRSGEWIRKRLIPRTAFVVVAAAIAFGASWIAIERQMVTANLLGADLSATVLMDADLRRANLRWANLKQADLRRAILEKADLRSANFSGTDLRGVTGLTCTQIRATKGWESAYRESELACGANIPEN